MLIPVLKEQQHRYAFILLVFLAGLVFSKFLLSISLFLLSLNWIFEKELREKWIKIRGDHSLHFFLLLFFLHIAGLLYTQDFAYAMKDIRIKLPLLVIPLIFASIQPFSEKIFKRLLFSFVVLVFVSCLVSIYQLYQHPVFAHRNISVFMSHIRFGLLIAIAACYLLYELVQSKRKSLLYKALIVGGFLFFSIFLFFILGSINAIGIYLFVLFFWGIHAIVQTKNIILKSGFIFIIVFFFGGMYWYIIDFKSSFFPHSTAIHSEELRKYTEQGNVYEHDTLSAVIENGKHVYINICEPELIEMWERRSTLSLNGNTNSGIPIKDVVLRYLTSKGLTKDSAGVSALTKEDIRHIENGMTHFALSGRSPLVTRLYELFWGYVNSARQGNPNDHSIGLRLEYWKASVGIIQKFPLLGVGTGDVNSAFHEQYADMQTKLEKRWQLRSHNQFLSIAVAFGIIGLLIFLIALILPAMLKKKFQSYFFTTVFIILMLSMLTEDTIETQVGVSIFAFFYCAHLYLEPVKDVKPQKRET